MDSTAVAVIVATFGDVDRFEQLARRAMRSAEAQHPAELVHARGDTLAAARNAGAAATSAPWLCWLDADDELEPGYLSALTAAAGDLRAPAVRYVTAGEPEPAPVTFEARNMDRMNPCVVGTLVPRTLFEQAGGWQEWRAWEDWALFRRCWLLGATITHTPAAVYRAHVHPNSRNATVDRPQQLAREIRTEQARWIRARRRGQ